ncbi:MAG: OmpA family protein [Pseudomonadota bacterium]
MFRSLLILLTCALPALATAQTAEIFIPGQSDAAPSQQAAPQNRLAGCLANPDPNACAGVDLDPEGLALESTGAAPALQLETLILDLDDGMVTTTPEPPRDTPNYAQPPQNRGKIALPSIAVTIEFDFDTARLRADQVGKLASLASALRDPSLQGTSYAVIGHTDAKGPDQYNCNLSHRRAATVTAALQANYVLLPLYSVGFGEHVLKNVYDPAAAENRRVTFLRLPDQPSTVLTTAAAVCGY